MAFRGFHGDVPQFTTGTGEPDFVGYFAPPGGGVWASFADGTTLERIEQGGRVWWQPIVSPRYADATNVASAALPDD